MKKVIESTKMKLLIYIVLFLTVQGTAGIYMRISNAELAKGTTPAIIGTVLSVEDKSNNEESHQIVNVQIDGVLKGASKTKTLVFVARRGIKSNFHRKYKKGENGIFLLCENKSKFYLADPILGFSPFGIENIEKKQK